MKTGNLARLFCLYSGGRRPWLRFALLAGLLLWGAGCATVPTGAGRPFNLPQDALAFANELEWEYSFNPVTGKMDHRPRRPPPTFAQRCFPVTLAVRKFYYHAEFVPERPRLTGEEYGAVVRTVLSRSARHPSPAGGRVIIPGYTNLFQFSADHEPMLKAAIGGKWQSYLQRGNWRMVFPFTRSGQAAAADKLARAVKAQRAPIIHVVTFPRLSLNHVVLLAAVEETDAQYQFTAFDPNTPGQPLTLRFDRATRRFHFPRTTYFEGGPVNVYEIYRGWCY